MAYLVQVDEDACSAHGECIIAAPGVFELEDVARVVGTADDDVLMAAAESCPAVAIALIDAASNEQVYP